MNQFWVSEASGTREGAPSKADSGVRLVRDLASVLIAGFLWLIATVPIVTIVPATAALFAVTARPVSTPASVWSTFWAGFLEHLRRGLALGGLLALVMVMLMVNVTLAVQQGGAAATIVIMIVSLTAMIVCGTLVFLFPLMVTHPSPWKQTIRDAALLAGGYPLVTITCLAVLGVAAFTVAVAPPLLPITAGVAALTICRMAERAFDRVIERQSVE